MDDERFNLFYHVRHTVLPLPGEERQLKRLCGRLLSQKLDRTKPLWEIWVIEGVEGSRFALVAKVHHAMVDGISGMDLLTAVLSPAPTEVFEPGPPWQPRPAPTSRELLVDELAAVAVGESTEKATPTSAAKGASDRDRDSGPKIFCALHILTGTVLT